MNLTLTDDQEAILSSVRTALGRVALGLASPPAYLEALKVGGYLDILRDAGPLEAELIIEEAARLGVAAPLAARLLVAPGCLSDSVPLMIGLVDGRQGMVRYGGECEVFLALERDGGALLARAGDVEVAPLERTMGYPYASVTVLHGEELGLEVGAKLRQAWQVSIAAEAAGCMERALGLATDYAINRVQFNRPLGSFQAVQHRLARAHVHAEGTKWLARRAAAEDDGGYLASCAAAYACIAAQQVYQHTHQVSGAMGITSEYGLINWTHRLVALQAELGGVDAHAMYSTERRRAQLGSSSSLYAAAEER
jgi:hypothetical protein